MFDLRCIPGEAEASEHDGLASCVESLASGHPEALNVLHRSMSAVLLRTAQRITRSRADAEEVVADVFRYVWESPHLYHRSRGSAASWLRMLCRSRALDALRRHSVRKRAETVAEGGSCSRDDSPAEHCESEEALAALRAALMQLPATRRRVIDLGYLKGMSQADIATRLDEPLGTVKSHCRRGLATLRAHLSDHGSSRHEPRGIRLRPPAA